MRILFIQKEGGIFGAENYQLKIIPELIDRGIEIEFLRLYTDYQGGKGGVFIDRLQQMGVKTHELNIGKFPSRRKLITIIKLIGEGHFDLVHTHLIHADFYLSLLRLFFKKLPCPWISTKHGYDNAFTAKFGFDASKQSWTAYYGLARLSEYLCDKSFTISHGLRNFFIATSLAKAEKMEMIHYGFDFEELKEDTLDSSFRIFKHQVVIAGRLVGFKGHRYLIEAMTQVKETMPEAGLVIVGSGELESNLRNQVKELGLEHHVHFTGYSSEVIKWMYNSDLVVVPSISEGFGVVFLEAFNCKKPVVSWDVPSGNELMEEGKTGFLVKPYQTKELAEKIIYVLQNRNIANEVGGNAYEKLKSYFTLSRMVDQTVQLYHQSIQSWES